MIENIILTFREQAREHKTIKSFVYSRNYEKGSGKDIYPLLWLEDPITGRNQNNLFYNTTSFSVLFIPDKYFSENAAQNLSFSIGLNIIERIKKYSETYGMKILPDWTFTTLRNYYDDNAAGCRFSVNIQALNMQNICLIDEQFDKDGQLTDKNSLPKFDIKTADNCEKFVNKLPVFDIKTTKR